MTGIPTPNEIAQKLLWLSKQLDAGADALTAADGEYVRAKARYEKARAAAVLSVADELRGTKALAAERDALVDQRVYQEWLDLEVAEAAVRKAKEEQRVRFAQVELVRSLNAGVRADAALAGAA